MISYDTSLVLRGFCGSLNEMKGQNKVGYLRYLRYLILNFLKFSLSFPGSSTHSQILNPMNVRSGDWLLKMSELKSRRSLDVILV